MKLITIITAFFCIVFLPAQSQETLLLRSPSASKENVAFAYGGDVWIAGRDGRLPHRLAARQKENSNPILSPDGKWVAFTGNYDGNTDVYVISVEGGTPRRLTFHPGGDVVRSWDGNSKIVFCTSRMAVPQSYTSLFEVDITTGVETYLSIPVGYDGSVSQDKQYTAFVKTSDPMEWSAFKLYRGGDMCQVWVMNNRTYQTDIIPSGNAQNMQPSWLDNELYFVSDRGGKRRNIYHYSRQTKAVEQVTHFTDYDVRTLHAGDGVLAFEQGGKIFLYDPARKLVTQVKININDEFKDRQPHEEGQQGNVRTLNISPDGSAVVMDLRGDIFTLSATNKTGFANLTKSTSVNEKDPAWSHDGKKIAFFSDESGEYMLKIVQADGMGDALNIPLNKEGYYYHPVWSPDGLKIAYCDQRRRLYVIDLADKKPVEINHDEYSFLNENQFNYSWSANSKWLAYNMRGANMLSSIFLYDVHSNRSIRLTDGMSDAKYPVFAANDQYLLFTASTDLAQNVSFADISKFGRDVHSNIYEVPLSKKAFAGVLDTIGIRQRISAVPVRAGIISGLCAGPGAQIYYLTKMHGDDSAAIENYDVLQRKSVTVMKDIDDFQLSANGNRILFNSSGGFGIVHSDSLHTNKEGLIDLTGIRVHVEPMKEWPEMFLEVLRIERDFFYSDNLHGANIDDLKRRFEKFLPFLTSADDLRYLFREMLGEFVDSHTFLSGSDYPEYPSSNVGLLGADYKVVNGHYQFQKIFRSPAENWSPGIIGPLAQPGIDIKPGDYLLAINGVSIDSSTNVYKPFTGMAGKKVIITVNSIPSITGAVTYEVTPWGDEGALRMIDWVEGNRLKVDSMSGGKAAYIFLPDTHMTGYTYFNRYFFPQLDKKALIIDTRYNNGGFWSDYFIDLLSRIPLANFSRRDAKPLQEPGAVFKGPKVLLVNSKTASGGDLLAFMFKKRQLGTVVGSTTFGMLNSFTCDHTLLNGQDLIVPNLGAFDESGWVVENKGVTPDISVENYPGPMLSGRDPQLEKAVQVVLKNITATKPAVQPAPPIKAP